VAREKIGNVNPGSYRLSGDGSAFEKANADT
jgi:hypothetical protein